MAVASLWSSLEGSILFWGFVLGGYIAIATFSTPNDYQEYMPDAIGVWQVTNWADARFVPVDDDVVRREIARAAYPWTAANADSGLADHLLARRDMQVVTPSDSGIEVSRFP